MVRNFKKGINEDVIEDILKLRLFYLFSVKFVSCFGLFDTDIHTTYNYIHFCKN